MEWHDLPALPAPLTPAPLTPAPPIAPPEPAAPQSKGSGLKRTVLTAALSALLLVGGAAAVVSAASPDPGASSAPSTTHRRRTPEHDHATRDPAEPRHGRQRRELPEHGHGRLGGSSRLQRLGQLGPRRDAGDLGPDVDARRPASAGRRARTDTRCHAFDRSPASSPSSSAGCTTGAAPRPRP